MSMFNTYWKCKYDELITFYPRFYREVFEMDAILRAEGGLADGIQDGIELVLANNFIDSASEDIIALYEKFLGLTMMKTRTLDERRRLVKSYFAGLGKVSATRISELIRSYTGAETTCVFYAFDDEGNNRLDIIFERGEEAVIYISDIYTLLAKMLPAHIEYRAILQYGYSVVVGKKRTHYKHRYDLCGTKPETVLIAQIEGVEAVTAPGRTYAVMNYKQSAEDGLMQEAGQYPNTTTLAHIDSVEAVTVANISEAVMAYKQSSDSGTDPEAGTYPQVTTLAHNDVIDAATEAVATECSVDYIPCGTNYAGIGG